MHAVEASAIATEAAKTILHNGVASKVKLYTCLAEDFAEAGPKADVIVSEWMGYMLIKERMLPSVLAVREKCLKEGGLMIPARALIKIALFEKQESVKGIDTSNVDSASSSTPLVEICPPEWVSSEGDVVLRIDLA